MSQSPDVKPYDLEYAFEALLVATACQVPNFWGKIAHTVEIDAFPTPASRDALAAVRDIAEERGSGPDSSTIVIQRLRRWQQDGTLDRKRLLAVIELLDDADDNGFKPASYELYLNEFIPQLRDREFQGATLDMIEEQGKPSSQVDISGVLRRIQNADRLGERDITTGFRLGVASLDRIKSLSLIKRLPTGIDDLDHHLDGGMGHGIGVFVAGTGVGKCHAKGQKLLAYDGRLVLVEDVQAGDLLMGPDSKPRRVLNTVRGTAEMYEIQPNKGGDPWRVNIDHVLTLVGTGDATKTRWGGQLIDVSLREWLGWSAKKKHNFKLVHAGAIDFKQNSRLPLDPYFLGALLGDGSMYADIRVTTADPELLVMCEEQCSRFGLRVHTYSNKACPSYGLYGQKGRRNPIAEALRGLKLYGCKSHDKFIPHSYRVSRMYQRRELLAGLIDTDGSAARSGFDYVSKSRDLADGVAFVARSLGLMVSVKETRKSDQHGTEGLYHRVSIHGAGCDLIPVRLARKNPAPRNINKNSKLTGFKVKAMGVGDYYGFNLNGDSRYLLDDFTITHNSMFLSHQAASALMSSLNVAYATLELGSEEIEARVVANLTGLPINALMSGQHEETATSRLEAMEPFFGALHTRYFTPRATTVTDIMQWVEECEAETGIPVNLVIIDMASRLKGYTQVGGRGGGKSANGSTYTEQGDIFTDFRNWCKATHKWGWTGDQPQRGAKDKKRIDTDDVSDSMSKARECDLMITAVLAEDEQSIEYFIAKNRHAEGRKSAGPLPHDFALGRMVPISRRIGNSSW